MYQTIIEECKTSLGAMEEQQTNQHARLTEAIQSEQSSLGAQTDKLCDWSQSHKAQLEQRNAEVVRFLHEEMKEDRPTGRICVNRNNAVTQGCSFIKRIDYLLKLEHRIVA